MVSLRSIRRSAADTSPPTEAPAGNQNPFLPAPPRDETEDIIRNEGRGGGVTTLGLDHTTGPEHPPLADPPLKPAVTLPDIWSTTPATGQVYAAAVQLVGLHGGAGTSTMASLLGYQAVDAGRGLDNVDPTIPVLFVTRSHAQGLNLALRLGQSVAAKTLDPLMILGVVVVHDAPTLSKGLARTLRSVTKSLPHCWVVPWDDDFRHDHELPAPATHGRLGRDAHSIVKKAMQLSNKRQSKAPADQQIDQQIGDTA